MTVVLLKLELDKMGIMYDNKSRKAALIVSSPQTMRSRQLR
jgi:hypothetical protein